MRTIFRNKIWNNIDKLQNLLGKWINSLELMEIQS